MATMGQSCPYVDQGTMTDAQFYANPKSAQVCPGYEAGPSIVSGSLLTVGFIRSFQKENLTVDVKVRFNLLSSILGMKKYGLIILSNRCYGNPDASKWPPITFCSH